MRCTRSIHVLRASSSLCAALALSACLLGCATSRYDQLAKETAESAARGAVLGTYEGVLDVQKRPGSIKLFSQLSDDPGIRRAAHDVAEQAMLGFGDGISKASFDQHVSVLVTSILTTARQQGRQDLDDLIDRQGPKLSGMVRETLTASISDAGSELRSHAKGDTDELTRVIVSAAVASFVEAIGGKQGAADALGLVSEKTVEGAMRGLRSELAKGETGDAVGGLSHRVGFEVAGGVHDYLETVKQERERSVTPWIVAAIVGLTLLAMCAAALLVVFRRYTLANRALALLAERINKGGSPELKRAIKTKAEATKLQDFLSGFLVSKGL